MKKKTLLLLPATSSLLMATSMPKNEEYLSTDNFTGEYLKLTQIEEEDELPL